MALAALCALGGCVRPGEEEDEEEGRPLLHADLAHRCRPQEDAARGPQHLCPWGPGADWLSQEPLLSGDGPIAFPQQRGSTEH